MAKRRYCKGKSKRTGKRCRAAPLCGGDRCIAHSDKKTQDSTGFGGSQPGAGHPRKPRVVDVLRERVEEKVEEIIAPYLDALEHAVLHATHKGEVYASDLPDLGARIDAAEKLMDRVYGKPKQRTELTGGDGDPVQMEVIGAAIVHDKRARKQAAELRRRLSAGRAK